MRKLSKQVWFIGFVAVNLLIPQGTEAFFGDKGDDDGFVSILAAGLITTLLMDDMGSGGGGGGSGGGRSSLLGSITERLANAASRHHEYIRHSEEPRFMKYPNHRMPPNMLHETEFHHHPAEMQLHPLYSNPNPIFFSETNIPPIINMPFDDFIQRETMLGTPSIDFVEASNPFARETSPTIIIDETHNFRNFPRHPPPPDMYPEATEMRPRFIFPRIVRHFVQRFMRRTGHD